MLIKTAWIAEKIYVSLASPTSHFWEKLSAATEHAVPEWPLSFCAHIASNTTRNVKYAKKQ